MSQATDLLNWGPVSRVRRNHALEHATINLITQKDPARLLAGYSDWRGFWIIGDIDTQELQETVDEALARLNAGEANLAIHPNCGTNFVASGLLVGTAAWLGMLGTGSSFRRKLDRWPVIILLAILGLIVAQPIGPLLQANVTTSADPGAMQVFSIMRYERGNSVAHRVLTRN
jgi:hypothetical protein